MNNSDPKQNPRSAEGYPPVSPELEQLHAEIDAAMHRMTRVMASKHAEFQQAAGVSTTQYMLLKMIECEGPSRVSDLANLLGVKNPAASMMLQQLEAEGFVERRHDTADNRVVLVSLTEPGKRTLADADVYRKQMMLRLSADLTVDDLKHLLRTIAIITDSAAGSARHEGCCHRKDRS